MTDCRYCGKPLGTANAWRCTECDFWQFRGSFLIPELGNLALYGSLIAVLFTSFGIALFGKSAILSISPLACGQFQAEVYVSNSGNYEAILTGAEIRAYLARPATNTGLDIANMVLGDDAEKARIGPETGRFLTVALPASAKATFLAGLDVNSEACRVEISVSALINSKSDNQTEPREVCTCASFTAIR